MAMLQLRNLQPQRRKNNKEQTWKFFRELGLIDGNVLLKRNYENINDAWKGQPAYVIGASPSLRQTLADVGGWKFFDGKHTIGINHLLEDYDGFEWHLFLDKRFIDTTPYNLAQYKGTFFANCTTGMKPADNQKIFFTRSDRPSTRIEDGLYGSLSGIAAVNLALIAGANPIYLFGMEPGIAPISNNNLHFKKGYTGEKQKQQVVEKYTRIMSWFDIFKPQADRLRLVTDGGKWFPWMQRHNVAAPGRVKVIAQKANIVHLSFSSDVEQHADITRYIVKECVGDHVMHNINADPVPPADLYIAEHFLSTNAKINAMTPEQKAKTIDIVHTANCIPQGAFKRVVALTGAWRRWLEAHLVKVTDTLLPGIDLEPYKNITPDYDLRVFGRITRWRPGKIHPEWNRITTEILDAVPGSKSIIFTEKNEDTAQPFLKDSRVAYDAGCRINMFKGDFLKRLSVYVHANGSFKETLSFAVIEAMATGLPIVYLDEGTGVLDEVVAGCGVKCESINKVRDVVIEMLKDKEFRAEYGAMAKQQSIYFGKQHMVADWDEVITQCLK